MNQRTSLQEERGAESQKFVFRPKFSNFSPVIFPILMVEKGKLNFSLPSFEYISIQVNVDSKSLRAFLLLQKYF